jgi:hypothetical protein
MAIFKKIQDFVFRMKQIEDGGYGEGRVIFLNGNRVLPYVFGWEDISSGEIDEEENYVPALWSVRDWIDEQPATILLLVDNDIDIPLDKDREVLKAEEVREIEDTDCYLI